MKKLRLGGALIAVLAMMAALSGCATGNAEADGAGDGGSTGTSGTGNGKSLTIGYINWDEDVATTLMWKKILEAKGYSVKTTQISDAGPVYVGLAKGDIDLYLDAWLPATHKTYWDKYGDDLTKITKWYDSAPLTIAVPEYMKIDSLADLKG